MATQQSILDRILPQQLSPRQSLDLLEVLRDLDLQLDFARGVPTGETLTVFSASCARAFFRAHKLLAEIKQSTPTQDAGLDILDLHRTFRSTARLTAWMESIESYADALIEQHRTRKQPAADYRSWAVDSERFPQKSKEDHWQ